MTTSFHYGSHGSQVGDLHLPGTDAPAVICLLHGGYWKLPHGREQMSAIADDLAARGYAAWNIGYRRAGEAGGGWPGAKDDAVAAIAYLVELARDVAALDLRRVIIVGHSAGGQLALLAAAATAGGPVRPIAAVSQAGVPDLYRAHALGSGNGAVANLLGGPPDEVPERYSHASPAARLPTGVRQLILHGERDESLPVAMAREYALAARRAGDAVEYIELPGSGHMDFLDPASAAHAALCQWLSAASRTP